jgi:hypothetical protein
VHQPTRSDFTRRVIWELFSDRNIAIEVLDQYLEIAIQLKERKSSLFIIHASAPETTIRQRAGTESIYTYHGDRPCVRSFLSHLQVQERAELLCMLEIEFVEAAYAGQEDAIFEPPHIVAGL